MEGTAMSAAPEKTHYIIRGGVAGRERLRTLNRVMQPTTLALFERIGLQPGMRVLDAGCGGGDLAFQLARLVGPQGKVVGTDIDAVKLEMARQEAAAAGIANVEFRIADNQQAKIEREFDIVHARFLLTHLPDAHGALQNMIRATKPGGLVVIEDIDVNGWLCYPPCAAHARFIELYAATVQRRGGNPNIGPSLPVMLSAAGLARVHMNVVQPAGTSGDVRLITPLTMENIGDAVLEEKLASREEIDRLVAELYDFAKRPGTVDGMPRVTEAWGSAAS
jgi:SAM-dependent methyltransferase